MPMATKEEQNAYQKEWMRKRREAWLQENGPCVICQSWERLEVDHIDGSKKVDHKVWSWAEERRLAELAKCQVLCYVCHKKKTQLEQRTYQHGTYAMRNSWGCTCEECKEYVRRNKRDSRARIKKREEVLR